MSARTSTGYDHLCEEDIKGSSDTESQSSESTSASEDDSLADFEQDHQISGVSSSHQHAQVLDVEPRIGSGSPSSSKNHEVYPGGQDSFQVGRATPADNEQSHAASSMCPGSDANGNDESRGSHSDKPSAIRFRASNIDEVYLVPALGVEFESEEHAYLCYMKFSADNGFSIKREHSYKNKKTGEFISRKFSCYKAGWTRSSNGLVDSNKAQKRRTGCLSQLVVVRKDDGKFLVTQFINEHNHEFVVASKAHLLRSTRRLVYAQAMEVDMEENPASDGVPRLGMVFDCEDQAFEFYNAYGRQVGFYCRKDSHTKSRVSGTLLRRKFTCSQEGHNKRDLLVSSSKKTGRKSRIGCLAHMIIFRQADGRYRVSQFVDGHNHDLFPGSIYDGSQNYDPVDYKNKLNHRQSREMRDGEAERMRDYFQTKIVKNRSFRYFVQVDSENQWTNIVWADSEMVADYQDFGDVLCIDTSFRFRGHCRPFVAFYGVNLHKDLIMFGASLVYDESIESMTWVLQKFIDAMRGSKPQVVLADQDSVIAQAVSTVMPESKYRVSTWHIYLNALDQLNQIATGSHSFATDLRSCFFSLEEVDFVNRWKLMLQKCDLYHHRSFYKLYDERKEWGIPWGRHIFCADVMSAQLGPNLLTKFWRYLKYEYNILQLLNQLAKYVTTSRYDEKDANYVMQQQLPNMMANTKMLKSAREVYTPKIFNIFQQEYEKSLNLILNQSVESDDDSLKYKLRTYKESQEYTVEYKSSDDMVHCECLHYEYFGVLCCHALKVLDFRNVKLLPAHYIKKRWTRDARGPINLSKYSSCGEGSAQT